MPEVRRFHNRFLEEFNKRKAGISFEPYELQVVDKNWLITTNHNKDGSIENGSQDIRLSTLVRIVNKGFGGKLKISVEINEETVDFEL